MNLNEAKKAVAENRLKDLSVSELKEAEKLLKDAGETKAAAQVSAQLAAVEGTENNSQVKEFNYEDLKAHADQNNLELKESVELLGNLDVQGTDGKSVDIKDEVVAAAQLKTDLSIREKGEAGQKVTQDDYQKEFAKNINAILLGMMQTEAAVQGKGDGAATQKKLDELTTAAKQGKKVTVSLNAAIGTMSNFAEDIDNTISRFGKKIANSAFGKGIKARWNKLDTSLRKKLGAPYEKARAYVKAFHEQGGTTAVGMMFVAGFGGPVGLGVYAGYVVKKRILPFLNKYKVENETKKTSFRDFIKANKKESAKAGLYAASAVAGFITAGIQAYQGIAHAAGAVQAVDSAVSYTSTAKLLTAAGAAMTEPVTELGVAVKEKKDVGKATKRLLGKAAMFGIGYGANELVHFGWDWYNNHTGEAVDAVADADPTTQDGVEPSTQDGAGDETNNPETANEENAQPVVDEGSAIEVGSREQALYERNLRLVPKSDMMVDNVNEGDVVLPNGMTPEMAVNLARVEYLYYGDDTGLKLLLGCDGVDDVNSVQYFRDMTDKFVTKVGDPRGLVGFPTDPNYIADPNIHATIKDVDCSGIKIDRIVTPIQDSEVIPDGVGPAVDENPTIPEDMQPDEEITVNPDVLDEGNQVVDNDNVNIVVAPTPETEPTVNADDDKSDLANTGKQHFGNVGEDAADMNKQNIVLGDDGRFHQVSDEEMADVRSSQATTTIDEVKDDDVLANTSKEQTHFDNTHDMNQNGGSDKIVMKRDGDRVVFVMANAGGRE